MDKDSLITNQRAIFAQVPVTIVFDGQTVSGGGGNIKINEKQTGVGAQPSYRRSVKSIKDDWSPAPAKRDVVTVGGAEYRILDVVEYIEGTAYRFDLGDKYERGRD